VALNYAFANRPGLVIPSGLTWVGIETYGVSLPDDNLRALEARLTPAQGVMLMPKAFINFSAPGEIDDAHLAAAAHAQAEYAVRDPRVCGRSCGVWSGTPTATTWPGRPISSIPSAARSFR